MGSAKGFNPRTKALTARLQSMELLEEDKELLARVRKIRAMRAEGLSYAKIAPELGLKPKNLEGFVARGTFRVLTEYIERAERGELAVVGEAAMERARRTLVDATPEVAEYVRECLGRDEKGEIRNDSKAMWAATFIGKATGLGESEHMKRPSIVINIGAIQNVLSHVRNDDAAAAEAAVIDVTPEEAP